MRKRGQSSDLLFASATPDSTFAQPLLHDLPGAAHDPLDCGSEKFTGDARFLANMMSACAQCASRHFPRWWQLPLKTAWLALCHAQAAAYYSAVSSAGWVFYAVAQNQACESGCCPTP